MDRAAIAVATHPPEGVMHGGPGSRFIAVIVPIVEPTSARLQERFRRRAERAIANRRVFRYLAGATLTLSFVAGVLIWIVDRQDFPTLGDGLWWALVTLATVGYGDLVPRTGWGRAVGSLVIVMGVTFLSILTAIVTSYLVSADQAERAAEVEAVRGSEADDTQALLEEIVSRLAAIEAAQTRGVSAPAGRPDPPHPLTGDGDASR